MNHYRETTLTEPSGFRHERQGLSPSQHEQDATRAREQVEAFAAERGLPIVGTYVENESGAKLARPELFRLIADSRPDDVLLVEQLDRLSRLTDVGDYFGPSSTPSTHYDLRVPPVSPVRPVSPYVPMPAHVNRPRPVYAPAPNLHPYYAAPAGAWDWRRSPAWTPDWRRYGW